MTQGKQPDDPSTGAAGHEAPTPDNPAPGKGKETGKPVGAGTTGGVKPLDGDRPPQTQR